MPLVDKAAVVVLDLARESGAGKALLASATEAMTPALKKVSEGQVTQIIKQRLAMRTMSTSTPLETLRTDAETAYVNGDWSAAKQLYENVVQTTGQASGNFGKNYQATGRLARANFHLGDYRKAETGFRHFLNMGSEPSVLRGHVYNELADIMEHTGRGSRAGLLRSHAAGNLAEKPDFSILKSPLKVPDNYEFSDHGIAQSLHLYEYEKLSEPFAKGFLDFGQPINLGARTDASKLPMMTVLDHDQDPALQLAAEAVAKHFGKFRNEPAQYAAALTEYTGKLFRPNGGDGHKVAQIYTQFHEQNVGNQYFFGEFLRRSLGVCNQRAAFIKTMADKAGLEATFYRGYVNKELTGMASAPHDFSTILINSKEKVYDAGIKVIGENFVRHSGRGYTSLSIDGIWFNP